MQEFKSPAEKVQRSNSPPRAPFLGHIPSNPKGVQGNVTVKCRLPPLLSPDATRARTMRAVHARGNASTELAVAAILRAHGLNGWRRHLPLPGKPDFAWPKRKVVLFVDGCFWHGCPYCARPMPIRNAEYWAEKIRRNIERDRRVRRELRRAGWSVVRVWEHAVRRPAAMVARLQRALERNAS